MSIDDKRPECAGCPYVDSGAGFVPDFIPAGPIEYVIVGDRPWKSELAFGQPFAGQAGFVLKNWGIGVVPELKLTWDRGRIALTNTLRCLPRSLEESQRTQRSKEHQAACVHCRVHNTQFPESAIYLLMGEVPQRALFGKELDEEDKIDRAAGREVKGVMGRLGRRIGQYVFCPHPSWILRTPKLVRHLQRSLEIGCNSKSYNSSAEPSLSLLNKIPYEPWPLAIRAWDMEWGRQGVSVLGYAQADGSCAVPRNERTWTAMVRSMLQTDVIVGHNYHAADLRELAKENVDVTSIEPKVFDTMLAMHTCFPHLAGTGSYDLRTSTFLLGKFGGQEFPLDWKNYEGDIYATCRIDAAASLWLHQQQSRIIATHRLEHTHRVSHDSAPIFARMRERGVRLDTAVLERIHHEREQKVQEIIVKYELIELRGKKKIKEVPIWRSPKILDKFEKVSGVRPKDRKHSTWVKLSMMSNLSQAARDFAGVLVQLGEGANDAHWLGSAEESEEGVTFEKVGADGLIHPSYRIDGSPDRPIAQGPNIQNFPRVKDDPRSTPLRAAVIPFNEDEVIVSADFGSIETYTNAVAADDWDMVKAIQAGERSHEQMAALCSKIVGRQLTRFEGKTANHAADKGESPSAMAQRLFGVQRATKQQKEACIAIYKAFLSRYPKTSRFRDQLWKESEANPLVVKDVFGRRLECFARSRYGDSDGGWSPRHDAKLKYWCSCKACAPRRERWKGALAFVGRAPAVTILLKTMIRIWQDKRLDGWSLPYIEVHDELDYSVDKIKAEVYKERIVEAFREPVPEFGGLSLPVEASIGNNWGEAK